MSSSLLRTCRSSSGSTPTRHSHCAKVSVAHHRSFDGCSSSMRCGDGIGCTSVERRKPWYDGGGGTQIWPLPEPQKSQQKNPASPASQWAPKLLTSTVVFGRVRASVALCIVYPTTYRTAPHPEPVIPSGCVLPDGMGCRANHVEESQRKLREPRKPQNSPENGQGARHWFSSRKQRELRKPRMACSRCSHLPSQVGALQAGGAAENARNAENPKATCFQWLGRHRPTCRKLAENAEIRGLLELGYGWGNTCQTTVSRMPRFSSCSDVGIS